MYTFWSPFCTFSMRFWSLTDVGFHTEVAYSRCGLTMPRKRNLNFKISNWKVRLLRPTNRLALMTLFTMCFSNSGLSQMSLLSPSQYYRLRSVVVSLARRSTLVQVSWLFQTLGALPFLDDTAVAIFCSNLQACRGHFEAIHHLPYSSPLGRSSYHLRTSMLHSQQLQVGRLWRSQKEVALERFLAELHSRLDFWTIFDRWQPHVASCLLRKFLSIGITFFNLLSIRYSSKACLGLPFHSELVKKWKKPEVFRKEITVNFMLESFAPIILRFWPWLPFWPIHSLTSWYLLVCEIFGQASVFQRKHSWSYTTKTWKNHYFLVIGENLTRYYVFSVLDKKFYGLAICGSNW